MTIYDDFKQIGQQLMSEFRQGDIVLISVTSGTGTGDDPGASTEVETALDATVKGVSFKYVREGLALATDLMVTSSVVDNITPSKNDFISIDGTRYKIIEDLSVPAAGVKVVWKFIVRK